MEINIQSTVDVDQSNALATLNTVRAIDSILEVDSSNAVLDDEYTQIKRAIQSKIEGDRSKALMIINCLKVVESLIDVDSSKATVKLNLIKALEDSFNVDESKTSLTPIVYRAIGSTVDVDDSKSEAFLNVNRAIRSTINADQSFAEIRYLFLKNPPLPPSGGVTLRATKPMPLKSSPTLIANSTHILDAYVVGERLASLHLVFTIRSMQHGQLIPHIQKSSNNTPDSYLQVQGGKGDIMIQSISPAIAQRGITQDLSATIMLLPHDFQRLPNKAGTYLYDLWAYDLLGTNGLIESGTIKVVS